jgi:hypothetical protein
LNITMPVPVALTRVTINFSATPRDPDNLSTFFADNVGSNIVTVFDAPLVGMIPGCFSNPCPFFTYAYTTPYVISPAIASGALNLLVDLRIIGPEIPFQSFDAADVFGDEVSRVFAAIPASSGAFGIAAEPTTGTADTAGLVMQFTLSNGTSAPPGTVAEPTSLALLGISLAVFGMTRRRKDSIY